MFVLNIEFMKNKHKNKKFLIKNVIFILVVLFILFFKKKPIEKEAKIQTVDKIIVVSSTYYRNSILYPENSVVVHFNSYRNISTSLTWYCVSSNFKNERQLSPLFPNKPFFQPLPKCEMQTFAANCSTVSNPTYFAIRSSNETATKEVPLSLRNAISESLPVVSCVSPLFFNERWQINMLSIEIYAYFGVARQAYYYMSILENGFLLLKEYEKLRMIDVHPWVVPDVAGLRTNIEFRNQATAQNDCFLLYREAADFIIVHDPDDLLFLQNMTNLWASLALLHFRHLDIGGFQFGRLNSEISLASSLKESNLENSLKSLKIGDHTVFKKSVLFTRGVESVNAHFADYYSGGYKEMLFNRKDGLFVHIRNITFLSEMSIDKNHGFSDSGVTNYVDASHYENIEAIFVQRLKNFAKKSSIKYLKFTNYYYTQIDDCYEKVYYKFENSNGKIPFQWCPSHFHCAFPPIPGVHCVQAKQESYQKTVNDLIVFHAYHSPYNVVQKNGCSLN